MGVILGLTGAVCWGMADFAARFASRRVGAYRTLFFMQFFGFIALSVYLKFAGGFSHVAPGWQPWALTAVAGLLNVSASLSLYYSFEIGVMSIVGPVSSSYPALTVALSIASGERINALRAIGIAVTLAGVILAAMSFAPKRRIRRRTQSLDSTNPRDEINPADAANPPDKVNLADSADSAGAADPAKAANPSTTSRLSRGVGWAILAASRFRFHVLVSRLPRHPARRRRRFSLGNAPHRTRIASDIRAANAPKPPSPPRSNLVAARRSRRDGHRRLRLQ